MLLPVRVAALLLYVGMRYYRAASGAVATEVPLSGLLHSLGVAVTASLHGAVAMGARPLCPIYTRKTTAFRGGFSSDRVNGGRPLATTLRHSGLFPLRKMPEPYALRRARRVLSFMSRLPFSNSQIVLMLIFVDADTSLKVRCRSFLMWASVSPTDCCILRASFLWLWVDVAVHLLAIFFFKVIQYRVKDDDVIFTHHYFV